MAYLFRGKRVGRTNLVEVKDAYDAPWHPLPHLAHHSPQGFAWGYNGSGPADLALAILAYSLQETPEHSLSDAPTWCWAAHQDFKNQVIAWIPTLTEEYWYLDGTYVDTWLTGWKVKHPEVEVRIQDFQQDQAALAQEG